MIENVIFDIGRVLVRSHWKECMSIMGRNSDTSNKIKEITLNSCLWEQVDLGVLSIKDMENDLIQKNPDMKKELREFFNLYSEFTLIDKQMENFLFHLKRNKYKIYILSNYGKEYFEELEKKADFLNYVDGKVISYEVKMKKPDPDIYQLLINKYHIIPRKSIFIDDRKENIATAKQMHFQTILFKNIKQMKKEFYKIVRSS